MDRIAKILIIAGLLLLLCAPTLAAAQADRPVKTLPCTSVSPPIDGLIESSWDQYAHWEDITIDFEVLPFQNQQVHPYGVDLAMMRNQTILYVLVTEYWEVADLRQAQEPELYSVFCIGFEDQPPAWEWNVKDPANDSDEGWLCFVGGQNFDFDDMTTQDWIGLQSVAFFMGRIGGDQEASEDCFDGLWVDFEGKPPDIPALGGVDHAFAAYYQYQADNGLNYLKWVHEVAIDLSASPLSPNPEDTFRAWFAALGLGPSQIVGAELRTEGDFRALAETIGQPLPQDFLIGLWPGGRGMTDPADDPEKQAEDMLEFIFCCEEFGQFEGSCDWCVPCFGRVDLEPCEPEFVPEPGTLLLLGSGLLGLGGYASLRLRKH